MKIEIWSDFVCPFCYLGHRHLELALEEFRKEHDEKVEIIYRSFQLNPDSFPDKNQSIYEFLSTQKGITLEFATSMHRDIKSRGELVGLNYEFDKVIPTNTKKAHQIYHYCASIGKGNEAVEKLFEAYFTNGRDLENIDDLIDVMKEIGVDAKKVKEVLDSDLFLEEVDTDIYEAFQIDVTSVPYFVFEDKYVIKGAQPVSTFLSLLKKVSEENKS